MGYTNTFSGGRRRPIQPLKPGGAVAEVIAKHDRLRHRIAQAPHESKILRLKICRASGKVTLECQCLLADIPLKTQFFIRHDVQGVCQGSQQGCCVRGKIVLVSRRLTYMKAADRRVGRAI